MAVFDCDDKKLEAKLRETHEIIVDNGGFVHEKLTIKARNNQIKILASPIIKKNEKIIDVPSSCLIPVENFGLRLRDDQLYIEWLSPEVTEVRLKLLELQIDIYNITKRVEEYRRTSTVLLKYSNQEIFEKLYEARLRKDEFRNFSEKFDTFEQGKRIIEGFINTRKLVYAFDAGEENSYVLMPILDFLNNHPRSPSFQTGKTNTGKNFVSIVKSCQGCISNECYVCYGIFDSHDLFLIYNYVEPETYFTRSVPCTIDILGTDKKIEIFGFAISPMKKNNLPKGLQDLNAYFPPAAFSKHDENILLVPYIPIPQEAAPLALRRILGSLIRTVAPGLTHGERKRAILDAERRILEKNLEYYFDLFHFLVGQKSQYETETIIKMALRMVSVQIVNIQKYPFFKYVM